jgi:glutamate-1-semialdehyde aminotransferase
MCTLNCPEEVELAKRLIALHPWAQMARFSRTGGEACAIAVRIARAATAKELVAFCGYHGWHDWYLSSNIADSNNLDAQLLVGLSPKGVPTSLRNTALPFHYNRLDELEKIVRNNPGRLAAIIMEPTRSAGPEKGFLEGVRKISRQTGAVLIFDEVTSGFRVNLGGIHLTYGIEPDMAVFGKALGNGFPISAVLGRSKFMDQAQNTFISSTFWTECVGFAAALATLEKMKKFKVQQRLIEYGKTICQGWQESAVYAGIKIKISGISPLPCIGFDDSQGQAIQSFYTQEMLKKGFLAGSSLAATYAYTPEIIKKYLMATREVFKKIGSILRSRKDMIKFLHGPVKHSGFKRLT